MYKISDKVIKFIEETMKNWRIKVKAGGKCFAEVKIQRGIFQRDAVSPLLFIIAVITLNHIRRKCTGGLQIYLIARKVQLPRVNGRHQTFFQK